MACFEQKNGSCLNYELITLRMEGWMLVLVWMVFGLEGVIIRNFFELGLFLLESLSEFELFFNFLSGLMWVKLVPEMILIEVVWWRPEVVGWEGPWGVPVGFIIEDEFIGKGVVNDFKRTITLVAFGVVGKKLRIGKTAATEVNDQATSMVAWFADVADGAVHNLDWHSQVNIGSLI